MPQAVVNELAQGRTQGIALPDPTTLSWITLCSVPASNLLSPIPNLGLGEREVLSLAVSTPKSLVILDDALARGYARQLNIMFAGTLGVLLKAKQLGYIAAIAPVLDQLDSLRFRLSSQTRLTILRLANEAP